MPVKKYIKNEGPKDMMETKSTYGDTKDKDEPLDWNEFVKIFYERGEPKK